MPPVHDAETHDKVKITESKPYGCSNAPRSKGYYAPHRYYGMDGTYNVVQRWIQDTMSQKCRYDMRPTDPRCGECKLPSDTEYLESYGK